MRRRGALLVIVTLGLLWLPGVDAGAKPLCGPNDTPETGLQGDVPRQDQDSGRSDEGYNCGVALVGHSDLGGEGGFANMAWAGSCAYVAGDGIKVVDVSNPAAPELVTTLNGPGSDSTLETLHAMETKDRALLVAGRYGPAPVPVPAPVDIYDVRDCTHPKLLTTFTFPENVHNLTLTSDAKRLFTTMPTQVADLTDPAKPKFLGNLDEQIAQPTPTDALGKELAHEVELSPDGNTAYLGGQTPQYDWFTIADLTGWPARPPRIISQQKGRGHSINLARINGRQWVLHSEESIVDPTAKGCLPEALNPVAGAAQPYLSDVSDPAHPKMHVSQFRLAINEPGNCAAQLQSGVNASVHYHDVDDPARTTFAMLSMWNAGLRVVDVRNPATPTEVGYFNPGTIGGSLDKAWGHVRYVPRTGHIWFATESGGFWVVELEPQVRAALGLPAKPTANPSGRPAHRPVAATPTQANTAQYYCTLG